MGLWAADIRFCCSNALAPGRSLTVAHGSGVAPRSKSQDRRSEPLGLHVVHEPSVRRNVDIIFVHGLGGTSQMSWSWNRDLSMFWPREWLPLEPQFQQARIMTFGYNAYFMSQGSDTFNISDFAKDLLLQMKFGADKNAKALELGQASSFRTI